MTQELNRRAFLLHAGTGLSAVWVSANWPALLAAGEHARHAVQSATTPELEFFTPEQLVEIDAVAARIIPTDDTPGAREAGVAYFIDRGLVTFAKGQQQIFRDGLPALHALTKSAFPQCSTFSQATPDQQDQILHRFGQQPDGGPNVFTTAPAAQNFFETVRWLTIAGFLIDPDTRGNPNGVGWKLIGRDRAHTFQAPFGYYDKDYPGWQPTPAPQKGGTGQ
ncbi:MAG TPA: gluconate 2-dehydrogenase subunit 3 family protein [Candidatus Acidoferrum sp.]|nr:gluconate 2-dehydrogenase subunit 3 family protein [Candidatus Acidoferrum sp.]